MRLFLAFLRAYPRRTSIAMLCMVLGGFAEGIGISALLPLVQLAGRDPGTAPAEQSGLERAILGLFGALGIEPTTLALLVTILLGLLLKSGLTLLAEVQAGYAVVHMATDLRLKLIRALLRVRWPYFVNQRLGEFAGAVALEATQASEGFLKAMSIFSLLVQATIYSAAAVLVSWRATLVAVVAGGLVAAALSRLVRKTRRAGIRQVRQARRLLARLTDTLQAVKPVKAMAREPLIQPFLEAETRGLKRALRREVEARAMMEALQDPAVFALLAVGLYLALALLRLPFSFVAILVFLSAQILSRFGKVLKEYQRMVAREAAFWRVHQTIAEAEREAEVTAGAPPPQLVSEIRFENVTFAYDGDPVIRGASFEIPAGQLTVLVGPSGSGKTTAADLIIGLLRPSRGKVLVDGADLGRIDLRAWRDLIGYVPQETLMLHDSVAANVTLGDPNLSEADVERALRAAGAWSFVSELPEGMHTTVGERGLRISGGQRQRIALARALVRRPRLLLLDEATTALDPATERSVCETLRELRGHLTLLAICHHGALMEIADRVYRVQGGCVELVRRGAPGDVDRAAGPGASQSGVAAIPGAQKCG